MATNVARRRTSATRAPRRSQTEEPQATESTTTTQAEEPSGTVDEGNPIHVDDAETEENFMAPVSDEIPTAVPSEAQNSTPAQVPAMSLVQKYNIASILTFADCAVAKSPEDIFDILARNFVDNGALSFWLNKVNYEPLTAYSKGHDLVDYIRKVSHELFKIIKRDIGKSVARW